jgi:molybdate transport system substrate-binding protein
MFRRLLLSLGLCLALPAQTPQATIRIAAAADLRGVLEKLRESFRKGHPSIELQPSFAASGALLAQIRQGAPFDLYLAADLSFPDAAAKEGLADGPVFTYAEGRLALWIRKDLALDPAKDGLKTLLDPRIKRVAIANPAVAPYGHAAVAALAQAKVAIEPKLLRAENVAQAAQYLQSGAADAGLVSLAQARHPGLRDGARWILPPGSHPPLSQGGVVLKRAANLEATRSFRDFLLGGDGRAILAQEGYGLP